ncbi:MAG: peptidoglycan-binding protein [Saprospiraceae bacterium]|nr:peptidoglycan-binding protein [Saprospiraceae bacterium]
MVIGKNSGNALIKSWQSFLVTQGFLQATEVDGLWGNHTVAATKSFQTRANLNPDGEPGTDTIQKAESLGFSLPSSTFPPAGLLNAVFDISHSNESVDLQKARKSGMLAVFHKATQSLGSTLFHDLTYASRRASANAAGLLWGAYHFGSGGSGKLQAQAFLSYAKPDGKTLLVLDFEPNTTQGETTMQLAEAVDFVNEIFNETGKYPGIYSGNLLQEVSTQPDYAQLNKCWLWKAQYGSTVHIPPGWQTYTFWQYTDGSVGPLVEEVEGVGKCDRDVFNGNEEALRLFWSANAV